MSDLDYKARIEELLNQAFSTKSAVHEAALLEEAIRIADSHRDEEAAYALRKSLIHAATFGGIPEKVIAAYSWCLALCDRKPDEFPEDDLLWHSKWAIDVLSEFASISRQQVEMALDEMTHRYQRSGAGMRSIYKLRCCMAMDFQDQDAAKEAYPIWQNSPRDWASDCQACDLDTTVRYHIFQGDDHQAIQVAKPILSGAKRCAEVPHLTYGSLLMPFARVGQLEEAMELHRKGYRMVSKNRDMLITVSRHLEFLTHTSNFSKAIELFARHLPWHLECKSEFRRFDFAWASRLLWESYAKDTKSPTRKLRLPSHFTLFQADGVYQVHDLLQWSQTESQTLANQLDHRNQNTAYQQKLNLVPAFLDSLQPFPIK